MKKQRACAVVLTFTMVASFMFGCSDKVADEDDKANVDISEIIFTSPAADIFSVTISDNAEVYAASLDGGISRYTFDGHLLDEYPNTEGVFGLFYCDGFVYGFVYTTGYYCDVVELDTETGALRTVYANLLAESIKSLTVSENLIFITTADAPKMDYMEFRVDYMGALGQFLTIDVQSGELTEITAVQKPIAHYQSGDNALYIYTYIDGRYTLNSYNAKNGEVKELFTLEDVGYLLGFAYEGNHFVYNQDTFIGVKARNMLTGMDYIVSETFPSTFGGCFSYYEGNIIFVDQQEIGTDGDSGGLPVKTSIRTLRLYPDFVVLAAGERQRQGSVTIATAYYDRHFDTEEIYANSGIITVYIDKPHGWDELLEFNTSILAGDDSVDIYVFFLQNDISRSILAQGRYVPLTDSGSISGYLDQCFDWVGDAARAPNGDIWMLPIYFNMPILWYNPENFERFGLTPDSVALYDDYLNTVERLNLESGGYTTHATYVDSMANNWFKQYEHTYNDYANGVVAFKTDVFSKYFETMWTGYVRYSDDFAKIHHPILQQNYEYPFKSEDIDNFDVDYGRIIFSVEYMPNHNEIFVTDLYNWRALPMPRLTSEVERNYSICTYAVVNPNSKNKELAVAYLEAAASNMLSAINKPVFVQESLSNYDGYFDMSVPIYRDVHDIFRDGAATSLIYEESDSIVVEEYQNGRISLEEAIDEIQRKVEMWLFE